MDIKKRLVYNSVMSRIKNLFIPLALFLLSFFIRLAFISKGPFHHDALELAIASQKTLETLKLHYMHIPGSPLTVIIAAINLAIFRLFAVSDPIFVVNFMAVYFSSLCVVMLYFLAKEFFDEFTGIFSAAFLTVLPPFLAVSTYGKDHAAAILLALTGIYLLLKYLASQRTALLIFSGISLGLCGSMRIADSLIAGPILLFLIMKLSGSKNGLFYIKIHNLKTYIFFILAMVFPLLIFYIPLLIRIKSGEILVYRNFLGTSYFMGLVSSMLPLAIGYLTQGLSPWGLTLSFFGLYLILLKDKKVLFFFLIWFLTLFLYYGNINTLEQRYLIISFIPLVMSIGYLFSRLTMLNSVVKICSWALFFAIFIHLFSSILPFIEFNHRNNLQADFAHWVSGKTERNAVILAMDENIFIEYYAKRETLGIPEVPITCDDRIIRKFLREYVDRYLKSNIPLYITTNNLAYDPCGTLADLLQQNYAIKFKGCRTNEAWYHSSMELLLFRDCLFKIEKKKP